MDPQPLRKKIADILDQVYSEADDTDATCRRRRLGTQLVAGRRAQGEPGRAVSAGIIEGGTRRTCRGPNWQDLIKRSDRADDGRRAGSAAVELAARIRDEIADLKKELRGMDAAGLK